VKPRAALLLPLLLAAPFAQAASPVGAWTGRFDVPIPPLPANLTAQQKAMAAKAIAQIKNGRIYLTLKADHTYSTRQTNLPSLGPASKGTWSQKGAVVTMSEKTPSGQVKNQAFTLSANGKTLAFAMPGGHGRMVFSR